MTDIPWVERTKKKTAVIARSNGGTVTIAELMSKLDISAHAAKRVIGSLKKEGRANATLKGGRRHDILRNEWKIREAETMTCPKCAGEMTYWAGVWFCSPCGYEVVEGDGK